MNYTEIRVELPEGRAQPFAIWLCEEGLGYQEADQSTLDPPPVGRVRFHLYVEPGNQGDVLASLHETLDQHPGKAPPGTADEVSVTVSERNEDEWRDAWKRYFSTRRIGRLAIVPSWEEDAHVPGVNEVVLRLDPGRAFGTGGHPSTRLCLRLLGEQTDSLGATNGRQTQVLDAGCGCGVLAIAALLLWPEAHAVALDIDPEALEVTRENAVRNKVLDRMDISGQEIGALPGTYDLVLANLSGPTLLEHSDPLAGKVRPGGTLVLSGILTWEAEDVAAHYASLGLSLSRHETEEEWSALLLFRSLGPAPAA